MSRYAQDLQGNLILIAGNADYDVIAPKETSPATAPHTKGSRIFYGNALYEVTANIAVNDALVIGTNITASDDITTMISNKADKHDLVSVIATGATNTTGAPITAGTYFYLNGEMVRATATITNNEAFTLNTNYEEVPTGGLNDLKTQLINRDTFKTDNDTWQTISQFALPASFSEVEILIKLKSGNSASMRFTDFEFRNVTVGGAIFYGGCFISGSANNLGTYLQKVNATNVDIKVFENAVNTTSDCRIKVFYK